MGLDGPVGSKRFRPANVSHGASGLSRETVRAGHKQRVEHVSRGDVLTAIPPKIFAA